MLNDILRRDDVKKLLREVCTNNRYNKKDSELSINYLQFPLFTQSLFVAVDALYKYSVIIEDIYLLDDYIVDVGLLFRKVSNIYDINVGLNKIIYKFSCRKLGYKDYNQKHNDVLKFVYDKYINNGYLFHAISSRYLSDIEENGFIPQKYNNIYNEFRDVNKIIPSVVDTNFDKDFVSFTDSFVMAYYYAISSPFYFYNIVCNNYVRGNNRSSYFKNDYEMCLKNVNKLILNKDIGSRDAKIIRDAFNDEWKLLDKSNSYPVIMMLKRNLLLHNSVDFSNIIYSSLDVDSIMEKIFNNRYNNLECNMTLDKSDISLIKLYGYSDFISSKDDNLFDEQKDDDLVIDEYGKVSFIMVIGALLITLGVIITIIMIVG